MMCAAGTGFSADRDRQTEAASSADAAERTESSGRTQTQRVKGE